MASNTPPSSQKGRSISFLLDGTGSPVVVPLVIRPEDLTRTEQSRSTVHQTLGKETSGWVDNFGAGLPVVSISGHTGWRAPAGQSDDGAAQFVKLHKSVFEEYHKQKQSRIDGGMSPDSVKLIFVDELDRFAYEVVPMAFSLKRSKSRPLLMMYSISLQAISTTAQSSSVIPMPSYSLPAGIDGLIRSIGEITGHINDARLYVQRNLVGPVKDFMAKTSRLYSAVVTAIRSGAGIADQLIGVARMVSQSAMNVFRTLSAVAGIPALVKAKLIQVANEYSNTFCILSNALRGRSAYTDYSPLYGASNCSSTASGGRPISPLSGSNPFYSLFPTQPGLPVSMTSNAQAAVASSAISDVVLNPMSATAAGETIMSISAGMTVA